MKWKERAAARDRLYRAMASIVEKKMTPNSFTDAPGRRPDVEDRKGITHREAIRIIDRARRDLIRGEIVTSGYMKVGT